MNKRGGTKNYGILRESLITCEPLKNISTDILMPFDSDFFSHDKNSDKSYLIYIINQCTRFTKISFERNVTSKNF